MNKKQWLGLGLVAVAAVGLAACGNRSSRNAASSSDVKTKAAIVTDTGGVDDKSFNQSAWEGLQAWGKEHNLSKDNGFTYFQSTSEADYANNLQQAAGSYNLIFGVGFALHNAVEEAAKEHTDLNYVLIDDVIKDQKNVASVTFADNESGYLAGVAAAKTTKTKQVGTTVKDIANKAEKGEFPGGQVIVYSLKDKGVDLAVTNLSEEGKKAVEDAKAKILDGSVKVPEK